MFEILCQIRFATSLMRTPWCVCPSVPGVPNRGIANRNLTLCDSVRVGWFATIVILVTDKQINGPWRLFCGVQEHIRIFRASNLQIMRMTRHASNEFLF